VKRRFVLTPRAEADLQAILFDIAEDSPDTADRLLVEFYGGLQRLARSPGIGHYREELLDRRFRFWNFYSYVVVYAWREKPVHIHGKRHLAAYFRLCQ